jgi:glycosyltransferase involved in cell wall biosynthesis
MALATRALDEAEVAAPGAAPDPTAVLKMAERVIREGSEREGKVAVDIGPEDARCLLEAWLAGVGIDARGRELLDLLQADGFSHADLYRRARRRHERGLRLAVDGGLVALQAGDLGAAANGLFDALVPAFPYAPSTAFLGAEKAKLRTRDGDRRRVALIADGIGQVHGVTHTIEQIRERGVPGFDVDVIGTDPGVDRRLPAAAELELPFYKGMRLGVPAVPELVEALAEGNYDLVHVTAPGPAGIGATLLGRITGVPLLASYHTELATYAGLRADGMLEAAARAGLGAFYNAPARVLSPSPAADGSLAELGVGAAKVGRWERGVDARRFDPAKADRGAYPGEIKVLYAGRLSREKGVDLLADAFLAARAADPRLHLLLAGGGPEEAELRSRLGDAATFLGWLDGEDLAVAYASADAFLFCSVTDTYGQVILEAGASGLPVIAIAEGGPAALVENRHTGLLCRPDADHVAGSILQLAASPELRAKLGSAGVRGARARSWERSLSQLAAGYRLALDSAKVARPTAARRAA